MLFVFSMIKVWFWCDLQVTVIDSSGRFPPRVMGVTVTKTSTAVDITEALRSKVPDTPLTSDETLVLIHHTKHNAYPSIIPDQNKLDDSWFEENKIFAYRWVVIQQQLPTHALMMPVPAQVPIHTMFMI